METMNGGIGNDTIQGFGTGDRISGDDGDDSLVGTASFATVLGGVGNDSILIMDQRDFVDAAAGNDFIHWSTDGVDRTNYWLNSVDGGVGTDTVLVNGLEDGVGGWNISLVATAPIAGSHAGLTMTQFTSGGSQVYAQYGLDLVNVKAVQIVATGSGNSSNHRLEPPADDRRHAAGRRWQRLDRRRSGYLDDLRRGGQRHALQRRRPLHHLPD